MSELKPNQMSDWHIDGVAVHTADGTGLRVGVRPQLGRLVHQGGAR